MVDHAAPRKAATVVVLREGTAGPEALLLRRHSRSGFAADAWVFPGGVVDVADGRWDRPGGAVWTQRHWRGASGSRPRSCSACTWARRGRPSGPRGVSGRLHLIYPTIRNLEELAGHGSIDESFAVANAREQVRVIMPHIQVAPDGSRRTIHPDDPDYPGGSDGREPQRA